MDEEIARHARRQAALLHSLGLPRAAAEIEVFCASHTASDAQPSGTELDVEWEAAVHAPSRKDDHAQTVPLAG
jgi:hypothetical protein